MVNLSAFISHHAQRIPGKAALIYGDATIDYAELWHRVQATAAWLAARGIGAGDVVAVFMKNSPAFLEICFAVSHLGAVFLPINFRLAGDEAAYITRNAEAKLLLADAEFAATLGDQHGLVLIDSDAQADIRRLVGKPAAIPPMQPRKPGDLFRLMYTSGTTDRPKGVMHSYDNFYWKSQSHIITLGMTADDRLLCVGPLYHVGAFDLPGLAVLWLGGTMAIHRDFDPARVLASIEENRLTGAWLAPVMLGGLLSYPDRQRFDVSSLRWCVGGGEKTPEARIRAFADLFVNGRYVDAYGLTESCSGDTMMEAGRELEKIGSTGRSVPHVEISIRDEAGEPLGADTEGEICLRGPKVTAGYWKDPAKTGASFWGDWFRTGDVGFLDKEGFLYLTDRKKDMIISGGENIASSEVERVLYQLAEVNEVAVIGIPDQQWGEIPVAVVVLQPGRSLDLQAVQAHCRRHLAGFKVPKQLHLREKLPRNPSGKILKRSLRDAFCAGPNPDQRNSGKE
ncbi:MAG TPA: AMP-binding protein [Terriglobia bacterium]|nr:AMP-binding protein [Terriglobia bacterium]